MVWFAAVTGGNSGSKSSQMLLFADDVGFSLPLAAVPVLVRPEVEESDFAGIDLGGTDFCGLFDEVFG